MIHNIDQPDVAAMEQVTSKSEEQFKTADPKTLSSTEQILRQLIQNGMTVPEAIEALEELP